VPRVVQFLYRAPQPDELLLCASRASGVRHRKPVLPQAACGYGNVCIITLFGVGEQMPQVAACPFQLSDPAKGVGRFHHSRGGSGASMQR
jgi:hypothetical protein